MPEPSDYQTRSPCAAFAGALVFLMACKDASQEAAAPPTVAPRSAHLARNTQICIR
jgi:hypothetical protein